jgi:hypothetical protein
LPAGLLARALGRVVERGSTGFAAEIEGIGWIVADGREVLLRTTPEPLPTPAGEPLGPDGDRRERGRPILRLDEPVRHLAVHDERLALLAGDLLVVARVGGEGELSEVEVLPGVAQEMAALGREHAVLFTPGVSAPAVVVPLAEIGRWSRGFVAVGSAAAAEQPLLEDPARALGGDHR